VGGCGPIDEDSSIEEGYFYYGRKYLTNGEKLRV